ncbi:MAG: xanthine dehydrogenase small subunit [Rubrivivax sp.]|nr:xanthine dehydrogenase small subunit [Rubrivivax sp.]
MTTTTRPIRFWHRGALVETDRAAPTRTVLEWLREDARCTGTKEGCAEGDCGACTVVVGELDGDDGLQLRAVNACIRFLPTLDGRALFTVEDLSPPGGPLHPVQQAMVDCHGSQCGFCTPGIVMSLWGASEACAAGAPRPDRRALADLLAGNLCRCTGYRPILDAGERLFELPPQPLDRAPVIAALKALRADPPLRVAHAAGDFHAPRTLAEFAALREAQPQARILSGATDIGLWVNKQFRELGPLLYVGEVAELKRLAVTDDTITIAAAVSLEEAWRALVAEWPALRDVWLRFASPPVRHAGSFVGNVANGSPIGDAAPVLMALGAVLLLRRGERQRRLALDAFYLDYMKNALEPGEFVQAVEVPRRATVTPREQRVQAYKVSKRFDSDISALCAGLAVTLDGERIADVRLAFGGMAATVRRATGAEAALRGRAWDEAALADAQAALAQDFAPLSDLRASADYRRTVAQQLLRRFWLQTRPHDPLPEAMLSVWARDDGGLRVGEPA